MSKFVVNCADIIDWHEVILHLEDNYLPIVKKADPKFWLEPTISEPDYIQSDFEKNSDKEMCNNWTEANYFFGSAVWLVYRTNQHYCTDIENLVCQLLDIDLCSSMIARIDPGHTVPIHFDPDDDFAQRGDKKVRFTCQISPSSHGQVLMIGRKALVMLTVGDIFRWDHYLDQHSAANVGLYPVYYFSVLGFKRD